MSHKQVLSGAEELVAVITREGQLVSVAESVID